MYILLFIEVVLRFDIVKISWLLEDVCICL